MRYLIDSHALIWFLNGDNQLSANALAILSNSDLDKYVSIAALWEIGIKINLGRLHLSCPFTDLPAFLAAHDFRLLPTNFQHILSACFLPPHHADPFDRMMIGQALCENITVITRDPSFPPYGVATAW